MASVRLAPIANRTAVTAPIAASALAKLASVVNPAARHPTPALHFAYKDHLYNSYASESYGRVALPKPNVAADNKKLGNGTAAGLISETSTYDSHASESYGSEVDEAHQVAAANPEYSGHFRTAPSTNWSTGIKRRADGSIFSRTVFQAPVNPFLGVRHASSSTKDTTDIPDFSKYRHAAGHNESSRAFTYLMVGSTGVMFSVGGKAFVQDFLTNMSMSKDVLALAKVEVDLNKIPLGKNLVVKWRGKPIFIRHRTSDEIEEANQVDMATLRDKQTDADRVKDPNFLVMVGVCTHLGCVPIGEAGEFGGWFCPCHGSHYDISGRIRKGPAPLNLEVPLYNITPDNLCVIG